jgi:hypothetical protein
MASASGTAASGPTRYLIRLLRLNPAEIAAYRQSVRADDRSRCPARYKKASDSTPPQATSTGSWPPSPRSPPTGAAPSPTAKIPAPATTGPRAPRPAGPAPSGRWARHAPRADRPRHGTVGGRLGAGRAGALNDELSGSVPCWPPCAPSLSFHISDATPNLRTERPQIPRPDCPEPLAM